MCRVLCAAPISGLAFELSRETMGYVGLMLALLGLQRCSRKLIPIGIWFLEGLRLGQLMRRKEATWKHLEAKKGRNQVGIRFCEL